jgi:hypothetical protein
MDNVKFLRPSNGPSDDLLMKSRSADIALASSPPTISQAINETRSLASCFTGEVGEDRLNAIVEIFRRFPLSIIKDCTDMWSGIACQRVPDFKTGKLGPRRFMPSNSEIREWCEDRVADLTKLAKAAQFADRPINAQLADENAPHPPRLTLDELRAKHGEDWGIRTTDAIDVLIDDDPDRQLRRAFWLDKARRRDRMSMIMRYVEAGMVPRKAKSDSDLLISPSLYTLLRGVPLQPDVGDDGS